MTLGGWDGGIQVHDGRDHLSPSEWPQLEFTLPYHMGGGGGSRAGREQTRAIKTDGWGCEAPLSSFHRSEECETAASHSGIRWWFADGWEVVREEKGDATGGRNPISLGGRDFVDYE